MLFIWILSALIALIQLSWIDPGSHNVYEEATAELIRKEIIYDAVSLVIFFFAPLVCMAFVYSKIFFEVSRQINNIRKESYPGWQKVEEEWYGCLDGLDVSIVGVDIPLFLNSLYIFAESIS